jgi:hypothetical protein
MTTNPPGWAHLRASNTLGGPATSTYFLGPFFGVLAGQTGVLEVAVTNPIYKTSVWRHAREWALARDGWQCQIKLPGCKGRASCVDHVVELEDGGPPFELSNLQAACRPCNAAKRNRSLARRAKLAQPTPLRDW